MTTERAFSIVDAPQRSAEWFAARCGRVTSSVVDRVFAKGRKAGDESVQRRDLRIRLALERLSGVSQDDGDVRTSAMQRGVDREDDARLAYEVASGRLVSQAGLLVFPDVMVGASLDGYVGDFEGIVELKCPKSATHIEYLREARKSAGWMPADYLPQIRHQLWISGAEWCDFVSFDDRMPEGLRLVIRRIYPAEVDLHAHALMVRSFLTEVEAEMLEIQSLGAAA